MSIRSKKSEVWDHFSRQDDLAKCNICNAQICWKGGCTSAMRNHCRLSTKLVLTT